MTDLSIPGPHAVAGNATAATAGVIGCLAGGMKTIAAGALSSADAAT